MRDIYIQMSGFSMSSLYKFHYEINQRDRYCFVEESKAVILRITLKPCEIQIKDLIILDSLWIMRLSLEYFHISHVS
jgi:hypothetical protein